MNIWQHSENILVAIQIVGLVASLMLHPGCSHNPGTYLFGEQTRLGFGEYGTYNAVRGMLLTDVPRENTSLEIEIDNEDGIQYDPASGTLKGITRIKRTVGVQITGYLKELAEVCPEAAVEYLRKTGEKLQGGDEKPPVDDVAIRVLSARLDALEDYITAPPSEPAKTTAQPTEAADE